MAELPQSPLPRDPQYWEKLRERIRDDAAAPLAAYADAPEMWYGVVAERAPWLLTASAAAMLALWLVLPPSSPDGSRLMEASLVPDEVAGSLVAGPEPPSVDELMVQFPPEE